MKLKYFRLLTLLLLTFAMSIKAVSAPSVTAKLDSVNLKMGEMTLLHLSVTQPKGIKGSFPLLAQSKAAGIVAVCGDSVELRAPIKIDTIENGNTLHINYEVPVQAFDSGFYQLPRFVFVLGHDSLKSNPVAIKVYPVAATAETPINDYASVADPDNPSIFDFIPDWILDLWWLWIIIILAILLCFYAMKKYKRDGYLIPKKPEPTPYEIAIAALRELKEKRLWEQGDEKEYFTQLTEILRIYLFKRFHINAMEMTSRQILASLNANKELEDKKDYFKQILNMADFVKFAKVRPLPEDNLKAYDNALRFVEETKPVENDPQDDDTEDEEAQDPMSFSDIKVKKGGEA